MNAPKCIYGLTTHPDYVFYADAVRDPDGTINRAYLDALAPLTLWSGKERPPAIGARVKINMNRLGTGTVENYFIEHNFLGVRVQLDVQPAWHAKQRPSEPWALVFGNEIVAL